MRYRNPLAPCTARARRSGVVVGAIRRISASGLALTMASRSGSAPAGKSVSRRPDTPAAAASRTKRSSPKAMSGFKYVMTTTGISSAARRIRSSTPGTVMPWSRAAWVERWMVGPSARGSENGTPTSTKSAPAAATARRASSDSSAVGNPAVRYGMSAARRVPALPRMARQRAAIGCSDKVIADVDAVLDGVSDLHDRAGMVAFGILLRKVGEEARVLDPSFGRGHDAHHRAMHMGDVRVGAVHKRYLVRVEDDARPHGIDADQVDERLHHDLIVAAPGVLPHLLEHLVRLDRHRLVHAPARRRVEPVGHGDDLGIDGQLARPQRLGVAGEVGLHVVLVGDDHAPIGDLAVAAQPEQGQHAEPRVRLHDAPLFVAQPALLVQYLERHTRLAHVVE